MSYQYQPEQIRKTHPAPKAKNGFGTSALVIGVAATTAGLSSPPGSAAITVALILGILGIIFGCLGISNARSHRANNGLSAIAGLITAAAGVVIALIAPSVLG